jgi:endonuclease-3 related protein
MNIMRKRILQIYRELETEYGAQNWWPADTPYEVMIGAILTQNTNWKNVEKAIENLKKEDLLIPEKILGTGNRELETLIRSSGYFRQKAERLKLATKKWIEIRSKLETQNWKPSDQELRDEWLTVNGIGPETADSILLYAYERPVFVIDAYTKRFCDHFNLFNGKKYEEYQEFFESNLPRDVELFKEFHALIVEWAKRNKTY